MAYSAAMSTFRLAELAVAGFRTRHECLGAVNDRDWAHTASGTGTSLTAVAVGTVNVLGVLRANLGTTAAGQVSIASPTLTTALLFGKGRVLFSANLKLVGLSTGTNTYTLRAGLLSSITGESTNGAFFRYTHGTNSGKWQALTRNNGSETATDTGVTAATSAFTRFAIWATPDGTSVVFFINGAKVATHSANIPTAAGREFGYGVMCLRSVGTASFDAYDLDALEVVAETTVSR